MSRRVLVTGGGGFIGSNLARRLLEQGDAVRVLDNFSTGNRRNLADVVEELEVVEGELRSYERVHNAMRGVEVVFHQGALPSVPRSVQDPLTTGAVNVEGTLNVLLAARDEGVRRVVIASSSSVYGNTGTLPRFESQFPDPLSPYAVSKLAAAVGVQLAEPDRPVVCVVGEGSVQYAVTAFWSAVAYDVPVTFLVMRNSEYAILKWFSSIESVEGAPGLDLPGLDTASVARGYGIGSVRANTADELREALAGAIAADRPELVEVGVAPGMWLF